MKRIWVLGLTGSGKTTLGRGLASRLGVRHVELDALYWEANWMPVDTAVFRARTADAISGDAWVADGNYSAVRDLFWDRTDTLIWIDLPFPVALARLVRRTGERLLTQEELWNGNRERLKEQLFSRDSLLLWAVTSYFKHRRTYPRLLAERRAQGQRTIRLKSQQEIDQLLAQVARQAPARVDTEYRPARVDSEGG